MSTQAFLCMRCTLLAASSFCFCSGQETFLCENCWHEHYFKKKNLVHLMIPIYAYGQHRVPGYFDRLHSRMCFFEEARIELLKDLKAVDECITKLTEEVQKVVNAVWEYGQLRLSYLQKYKEDLNVEIEQVLEEMGRTMHDDSPILEHSLTRTVREYNGDTKALKLFDYEIDSSAVINCIPSMFTFTCSAKTTPTKAENHIIVGLSGTRLQLYDYVANLSQEMTLAKPFPDGFRTCVLPTAELLCIGGNPPSTQTSIVSLATGEVQVSQPMKKARRTSGLICVGNFAYAFGSLKKNDMGGKSCEVFNLAERGWKILPETQYHRKIFTPSHLAGSIYLVSTKRPIEVYHIASNSFSAVSVKWTGAESACSSLFLNGQLYIFTTQDEMGCWRPGDSTISISRTANARNEGFCQCPPVAYKRSVFFVPWKTGRVSVFDIDTKVLTQK